MEAKPKSTDEPRLLRSMTYRMTATTTTAAIIPPVVVKFICLRGRREKPKNLARECNARDNSVGEDVGTCAPAPSTPATCRAPARAAAAAARRAAASAAPRSLEIAERRQLCRIQGPDRHGYSGCEHPSPEKGPPAESCGQRRQERVCEIVDRKRSQSQHQDWQIPNATSDVGDHLQSIRYRPNTSGCAHASIERDR